MQVLRIADYVLRVLIWVVAAAVALTFLVTIIRTEVIGARIQFCTVLWLMVQAGALIGLVLIWHRDKWL